ncbi:MAG: filamentous hemagglutinin N-terminal domain-containing protein [Pseudomonadota bacterium]
MSAPRAPRLRARLLAGAALAFALAPPAGAGPEGGQVRAGAGEIVTDGGTTTIRQGSERVVIDWRSFDIDADEVVRFLQPGREAIALNRVMNGLPTHIRGQLLANGNVWLVNPSGVMFHAGSVVDVGGLLATTADIETGRFMAGDYDFDRPGEAGAQVINEGRLTFGEAGLAGLVAPHAENRGVIEGRLGRIVVAGRESFSVDISGEGLFELDLRDAAPGEAGRAINSGRLSAEGGAVLITAAAARDAVEAAISVGGVVEARSARVGEDGAIVLDAGEGRAEVSGRLDVSGETGGTIEADAGEIRLAETARLDASGEAGGGRVRLGAAPGEATPPPRRVSVAEGARIAADAGASGDGGEITLWSSQGTVMLGSASARGGAEAGRGGFVELSSLGGLTFDGAVDLSAPAGAAGLLLIDPRDLFITDAPGAMPGDGDIPADDDPDTDYYVSAASLSGVGGAVTLQARRDIVVEAAVDNDIPNAVLTLEAGEDILLNADLSMAGGMLLTADADLPTGAGDGSGAIRIGRGVTLEASIGPVALSAPEGIDGAAMSFDERLTIRSGAGSALALPDAALAGGLDIEAGGRIEAGRIEANDLRLIGADGLALAGPLVISGPAVLGAAGGDIVALNPDNRIDGPVNARADRDAAPAPGDVSLAAQGDLALGIVAGRDVTLKAGGGIAGGGRFRASGRLDIEAGGDVSLGGAGNLLGDRLAISGRAATLTSMAGVTLESADLSELTLTAGGDVTQTGAVEVSGAARIETPGAVRLEDAGNDFGGAVSLRAESASIADRNHLRLSDSHLAGDLTARAGAGATPVTLGGETVATALVVERSGLGGSLDAEAEGGIAVRDVLAGAARLKAEGDIALSGVSAGPLRVMAAGDASGLDGALLHETVVSGLLTLSAPEATLSGVSLGDDALSASVPGTLTLHRVRAAGDLTAQAGALRVELVAASGDLSLTAATGDLARLADAEIDGAAAAAGPGTLTLDLGTEGARDMAAPGLAPYEHLLESGGDVALAAAGDIRLPEAVDGIERRLRAPGALTLAAGGDAVVAAAGNLRLTGAETGGALTAEAVEGAGEAGALSAEDLDVSGAAALSAEAGLEAARVRAEAFSAGAGGDLRLTDAALASADLAAEGALSASRGVISGDATAVSGEAMALSQLSVGGRLEAAADPDGSAPAPAMTLSGLRLGALSADSGDGLDVDATAVSGEAALRARRGDLTLGTLEAGTLKAVAEGGDILTRAGSGEAAGFAPAAPGGAPAPAGAVAARAFETQLRVGGPAWFDAAGALRLVHDAGAGREVDLRGAVTVSRARDIAIEDAGDLLIGAGATELPGVGAIGEGGLFSRIAGERPAAARLSAGGDILDTSEAMIRLSGDLIAEAGGDIRLASGRHDLGGTAAAFGEDVALAMRGDLRLGPVEARGAFSALANARDAAGPGAIRQVGAAEAPALSADPDAAYLRREGPVRVAGAADFATGAPGSRTATDAGGDLTLDDPENLFEGEVSARRIFGDVLLVEESAPGALAQDGRDLGELRLRNLEAGGDITLRSSDDIVLLGPLTELTDDETPVSRPDVPAAAGPEGWREQGEAGLALSDLRLFIADGRRLTLDTTAGGADPAGGLIRFDRPVDGANTLTPDRSAESVSERGGLGAVRLVAGSGHVRLRHYFGAGAPLGRFEIVSAGDVSLGHTYAARSPGPDAPDTRFLLGRGREAERDILVTGVQSFEASGEVRIFTPGGLLNGYERVNDYYGVNAPALSFGAVIEPESLSLFGFIGDSSRRAAGLYPVGPRGPEFKLNGCVIGDVQDCTGVSAPRVLSIVRLERPEILNVEEEDLLELFVSYGNEELWGLPPGYFLDIDLDEVRRAANRQASARPSPAQEEEEER